MVSLDFRTKWAIVLAANIFVFGGITCYWLGVQSPLSVLPHKSTHADLANQGEAASANIEAQATVTVTVTAAADPASQTITPSPNSYCDPYNEPGFYNVSNLIFRNTTYFSLEPSCQPIARNVLQRMYNREEVPELVNKTMVFFGDSVDRYTLNNICSGSNGTFSETYQDDHNHIWENKTALAPNCFPRMCHVEYLNMTVANYFMYGFDQDDIWLDKKLKFWQPFKWYDRQILSLKALTTLNRGDPHVVFVNFALWELARFDKLAFLAGDPESISLNETQLQEYSSRLTQFMTVLKRELPRSRIVYRESHFPIKPLAGYSKGDRPRSLRYSGQKVFQLNHVAYKIVKSFGGDYWPVGELTHNFNPRQLLSDDVHPKKDVLMGIWAPGTLEYLMRTSLDYEIIPGYT